MIGAAEEWNGLYYLKKNNVFTKGDQPILAYTSQPTLTIEIWLQHYRLGHPPFSLLRSMFPTLFRGLSVTDLHYDVCEFSKHHRVSYPISNKLSSIPFCLIHSDVWGPSRILNCSGARWFISFIDDCTRITWVYLLKDKAAINTILPIFHKMISTQFGSHIKRF